MTLRHLSLFLALCSTPALAQGLPAPTPVAQGFRTLDRITTHADGSQTRLWVSGQGRYRVLDGSSPPQVLADGDLNAAQLDRLTTLVRNLRAGDVADFPIPPFSATHAVTIDANGVLGGSFIGEIGRLVPASLNTHMQELDQFEADLLHAPAPPPPVTQANSLATTSTNAVAFGLYHQLARSNDNLAFSPYAVTRALGMVYSGASGETRRQIQRILRVPANASAFHSSLRALRLEVQRGTPACTPSGPSLVTVLTGGASAPPCPAEVEFRLADGLFTGVGFPILPAAEARMRSHYSTSRFDALDFSRPEWVRGDLNSWASRATRRHVRELLPNPLPYGTSLLVASGASFEGAWTEAFDSTTIQLFTLADGAQVPAEIMLKRGARLSQAVDPASGARAWQIPLKDGKETLVLLQPAEGEPLSSLEVHLNAAWLRTLLARGVSATVDLSLPTLFARSSLRLDTNLQRLGMVDAFNDDANFSRLTSGTGMRLGAVVHTLRARITARGAQPTSSAPASAAEVRLDRPFVYLVRNEASGALLLLGRMLDPQGNRFTGSPFWHVNNTLGQPLKPHSASEQREVDEVLRLVNQERAAAGVPPLELDYIASLAAKAHAEDMTGRNLFSSVSPEGWGPGERLSMLGDDPNLTWGENLANTHTDAASVMQAWLQSSSHRPNILSPMFTHIGVGYDEEGRIWVQTFVKR